MEKEKIMQFQMIEQEASQLNQQLELIEQNVKDIDELKESLSEINKSETKEILVNLGKKIYLPVEIKEKELVMEVGNKCYVKKKPSEVIKVIEEQIEKLNNARLEINSRLEDLEKSVEILMKEETHDHECKCGHNHSCNCEDACEDCECEDDECNCK